VVRPDIALYQALRCLALLVVVCHGKSLRTSPAQGRV
jgi:hypothetical protein